MKITLQTWYPNISILPPISSFFHGHIVSGVSICFSTSPPMSVLCLISPTPVLELNRQATFRLLFSLPCPSPLKLAAFLRNYILGTEILLLLSVFPRQLLLLYDLREAITSKNLLIYTKMSRPRPWRVLSDNPPATNPRQDEDGRS